MMIRLLLLGTAACVVCAAALAQPPPTSVEVLLETDRTITGEAFAYPYGRARVTATRITVPPKGTVPLHLHPVPLFVYVLQGEIVVDYAGLGERRYRKGDAFVEAFEVPHRARNGGRGNVELLTVYAGAEGVLNAIPLE